MAASGEKYLGDVLVLGMGGTGAAVCRYLASLCPGRVSSVTLYGGASSREGDLSRELEAAGVRCVLGTEDVAGSYDLAVASPGISEFSAFFSAARACAGEVIGEPEFAFRESPERWVAITGTNGKTTIATLLYDMFRKFGYKCGLCSTVCNYIDGEAVPTEHTTPDPITINRLLGDMVAAGCTYAFMECSSHAIHQKRIGGLKFKGALFTNLTRDHLDYHKTFENYRDAKKAFFDNLSADAFAITNADDKNGMIMVQNTAATVKTYSTRTAADFKGRILEESIEGMLLNIDGQEVSVRFVGRFNVSNLLAVYGAAICLGHEPTEVLRVLSELHPVNGRFEAIRSPKGFSAVIDYAHTPDALANVLSAINDIVKGNGQVITVCGAGGNRDKGKRPLMAREAANGSDRVIITSDNPRFEKPQDIINDMLAGLDEEQKKKVISIVDRREAIRAAAMMAQKGDVILVAGKGHEPYQDVKGVKHHFDDHEEVRAAFGIE